MKYDKEFKEVCLKLGKQINELREERQITVKELSSKTGVRVEYLMKIEQGKAYGLLFEKHLLPIAIGLKTKFSELLKF